MSTPSEPADTVIIGACLRAAANGPFFDDSEFHTLFGMDRATVAAVADRWPDVSVHDEDVSLAINNSLVNLLGYPHGHGRAWSEWIPASEPAVGRALARWRAAPPV
jgi:hypothetical protein